MLSEKRQGLCSLEAQFHVLCVFGEKNRTEQGLLCSETVPSFVASPLHPDGWRRGAAPVTQASCICLPGSGLWRRVQRPSDPQTRSPGFHFLLFSHRSAGPFFFLSNIPSLSFVVLVLPFFLRSQFPPGSLPGLQNRAGMICHLAAGTIC